MKDSVAIKFNDVLAFRHADDDNDACLNFIKTC